MKATKEFVNFIKKPPPTIFDSGVGARLPPEYRKFYDEWRNTPSKPVHYIPIEGKWVRDEKTGEVKRTENIPIKEIFPKEINNVFTGGEMVIQGFLKRSKRGPRVPHFWVPTAFQSVIYSEIMDKYMSVCLTKRAIELIHNYRGLDFYLLQTKACDLKTLVAIKLKRKLMLCLRDKALPYDEEKNKKILEKYEKFLPSDEEIEWYGLSFTEACRKLEAIEEEQQKASVVPLKHIFRTLLIQELSQGNAFGGNKKNSQVNNWYSKIPGISRFKNKDHVN